MVVVGTGVYKDTSEAYPLDRKTLNAVAFRSLFAGAARNGETADSIGWAWAMSPALKKIHTDEEDLALSMGHNLEYVRSISPLATLTMGVVLALEQQKADPETIRGVRTALSACTDSLGNSLFGYVLIPFTAAWTCAMAAKGNAVGAILFALVTAAFSIVLRFALISYGYAKGVRAAESMIRHADALKHAARIAGLFMLGALAVYAGKNLPFMAGVAVSNDVIDLAGSLNQVLPGAFMLCAVWLAYTMLAKKNKSVAVTALVILVICMLGALLGFFGGGSMLQLPWING